MNLTEYRTQALQYEGWHEQMWRGIHSIRHTAYFHSVGDYPLTRTASQHPNYKPQLKIKDGAATADYKSLIQRALATPVPSPEGQEGPNTLLPSTPS